MTAGPNGPRRWWRPPASSRRPRRATPRPSPRCASPTRRKARARGDAARRSGKAGGPAAGGQPTLLMDKLGERLAFEHAGARLYEALLSKHRAYGSFDGRPERRGPAAHPDRGVRARRPAARAPSRSSAATRRCSRRRRISAVNISAGLPAGAQRSPHQPAAVAGGHRRGGARRQRVLDGAGAARAAGRTRRARRSSAGRRSSTSATTCGRSGAGSRPARAAGRAPTGGALSARERGRVHLRGRQSGGP